MHGQPLRKIGYRCFCCAVSGDASQWPQRAHGGDVDDAAPPSLCHDPAKDLAALEGSGEICPNNVIDCLGIQVKKGVLI